MSRVDVQYLIDQCRDPGASPESKLIAWLAERELDRANEEFDSLQRRLLNNPSTIISGTVIPPAKAE